MATHLLIIRVVAGLSGWLFFNEWLRVMGALWKMVQAAFIGYLLLNLLVVLRYRRGRVSWPVLLADIGINIVPLIPASLASGGLASPLLLLLPLNAVHYSVVFGPWVAACFLVAAGALLGALGGAGRFWLPAAPLDAAASAQLATAWARAVPGLLVLSSVTTIWLRHVVAHAAPAPVPRPAPAGDRFNREGASAAVANALLTVSEAVSRLTRLNDILEQVVEIAPRSLDVDYCGIALWAEDTGCYTGAVAAGVGPTIDRRFADVQLSPEEVPDFEWVRRLGHCAVVPASETLQAAAPDVPSVLIAPLVSGDQFYGVMEFARRGARRTFTQRDFTIADGIARQTAVALERARLIEDSRRLILAVESTEEAVLITDARARVRFANPAFLRMFGYTRQETVGRDAFELAGAAPGWAAELRETVQRRSWRGEAVGHHKDGRAIPVMLNASLIRDDEGRIKGAVAILEDVSAQKSLQQHMQRVDRLAAVGEIAAGIAHEINNALAAIFGQTANGEQCDAAELRAALARVDGQARRIAGIVEGTLGFARPRPPRAELVDLAEMAARTLDLVRPDVERQGVALETAFAPDLPPAHADPQQVQQVLLNLFRNALQAMADRAQGWLRVGVVRVDDRLAVRVSDGGPGIPPEILPRIFDPFFSTKEKGSGLGLSVSYAIARAHGGDLQVESEAGCGTTFTLLLPMETVAPERIERVLLVDDDPDVAEALGQMLMREGLQVTRAATGAEALPLLAAESWDAVLLDVRLPDVSGPEIFAELQRTRPDMAQRVIFITGGLWRSESRLRQQLPAQPMLAKPCTQEQVHEVLRRLRDQRRQAA